jgi:hypothetical protein
MATSRSPSCRSPPLVAASFSRSTDRFPAAAELPVTPVLRRPRRPQQSSIYRELDNPDRLFDPNQTIFPQAVYTRIPLELPEPITINHCIHSRRDTCTPPKTTGAEIISAASGIAGLFTTTITWFDYIYVARKAAPRLQSLIVKLGSAQLRLTR